MGKVLKLAGGVPSGKLKAPPNSCMPSKAKIKMNKKSRNNRERIERIELSNDITRFLKDDQYLHKKKQKKNHPAVRTAETDGGASDVALTW